jgi:hypothetical protein
MLIDPDFFDHWRTRMLVDALNDECAPIYVMRIWSHCQLRKSDRFTLPPGAVKAICRFPGDADDLEAALVDGGWIERDGDDIVATGWAEHNSKLVAAWENGGLGGRPKKPNDNPRVTQQKPTDNPTGTQRKPSDNPTGGWVNPPVTNKTRQDKTGQEEVQDKSAATASGFDWESDCPPSLKTPEAAAAFARWQAYRREAKLGKWKPVTIRAALAKFEPHGAPAFIAAIDKSISNGWRGLFEPDGGTTTTRKNDRNTYGQDAASKADLLARMKSTRQPTEARHAS